MIPQEKIDAASLHNSKIHYVMAFSDQLHIDADMDFQSGVRFAESELKSVAMEFAEWIEKNCVALSYRTWEKITEPDSDCYTTEQLFAKFEAERAAK